MSGLLLNRTFDLLIAGMIVAATAVPSYGAERCVSEVAFEKTGNHLAYLGRINLNNLPYNFTCDFVPCFGTVEFEGRVDEQGVVQDLKVTKNTWEYDAQHHASVLYARLAPVRYKPPVVRGKPVCVEKNWHIELSPRGEVVR